MSHTRRRVELNAEVRACSKLQTAPMARPGCAPTCAGRAARCPRRPLSLPSMARQGLQCRSPKRRRGLTRPAKARFVMANGTAPLQASSGRTVRHRLNRGGNRQLNRAIHTAALTQIAEPNSEGRRLYQQHLDRGKTKREAIRALKRRISDRIWTHLQTDLRNTSPALGLT